MQGGLMWWVEVQLEVEVDGRNQVIVEVEVDWMNQVEVEVEVDGMNWKTDGRWDLMLVDDKNRIAINQFQYEIKGNDQKL